MVTYSPALSAFASLHGLYHICHPIVVAFQLNTFRGSPPQWNTPHGTAVWTGPSTRCQGEDLEDSGGLCTLTWAIPPLDGWLKFSQSATDSTKNETHAHTHETHKSRATNMGTLLCVCGLPTVKQPLAFCHRLCNSMFQSCLIPWFFPSNHLHDYGKCRSQQLHLSFWPKVYLWCVSLPSNSYCNCSNCWFDSSLIAPCSASTWSILCIHVHVNMSIHAQLCVYIYIL